MANPQKSKRKSPPTSARLLYLPRGTMPRPGPSRRTRRPGSAGGGEAAREHQRGRRPGLAAAVVGGPPTDPGETVPQIEGARRGVVLGHLEEDARGAGSGGPGQRRPQQHAAGAAAPPRGRDADRQDLGFTPGDPAEQESDRLVAGH